jgi:hypothetical protein
MEDVLELYAEAYQPTYPVVCFDECPFQMTSETRTSIPAKPGQPERVDYEYQREGICNLFMFFEPLGNWRQGHRTTNGSRLCTVLEGPG